MRQSKIQFQQKKLWWERQSLFRDLLDSQQPIGFTGASQEAH